MNYSKSKMAKVLVSINTYISKNIEKFEKNVFLQLKLSDNKNYPILGYFPLLNY